jgi:hypothetical protein
VKHIVDLRNIDTFELFDPILNNRRQTNLFKDLRRSFADKVIKAITDSGIKTFGITGFISAKLTDNAVEICPIPSLYNDNPLGVTFCAGYGVGEFSLGAVSYQHRPYNELPSLDTFAKRTNFSIGNFGFLVENGEYEFQILSGDNVKLVGYSYDISPKKKKSFIAIFGVHFNYQSLQPVFDKYYHITDTSDLVDIKLNAVNYPTFFMSRMTGKLYICDCFKDNIDWQWDFKRFSNLQEQEIIDRIDKAEYLSNICHYCNKRTPSTETPTSGYSNFLVKYASYYRLENKKRFGSIFHFDKDDNILVENYLRQHFGYPNIGEKWISETHLFNLVKEIYHNYNPIFHYRGKEMEGLELDIFIPELKLGIEYQGEQHYETFDHWGGEEGLIKRQFNDKRKVELCRQHGYTFVEFSFKDDLNRDLVIEKIEKNYA